MDAEDASEDIRHRMLQWLVPQLKSQYAYLKQNPQPQPPPPASPASRAATPPNSTSNTPVLMNTEVVIVSDDDDDDETGVVPAGPPTRTTTSKNPLVVVLNSDDEDDGGMDWVAISSSSLSSPTNDDDLDQGMTAAPASPPLDDDDDDDDDDDGMDLGAAAPEDDDDDDGMDPGAAALDDNDDDDGEMEVVPVAAPLTKSMAKKPRSTSAAKSAAKEKWPAEPKMPGSYKDFTAFLTEQAAGYAAAKKMTLDQWMQVVPARTPVEPELPGAQDEPYRSPDPTKPLFWYQKLLSQVARSRSTLLLSPVGTGKTRMAVRAAREHLRKSPPGTPDEDKTCVIYVCPAAVVPDATAELASQLEEMVYETLSRPSYMAGTPFPRVLITTKQSFKQMFRGLIGSSPAQPSNAARFKHAMIVVDEVHQYTPCSWRGKLGKGVESAVMWAACRAAKAGGGHVLAMTGTILRNSVYDMSMIVALVRDDSAILAEAACNRLARMRRRTDMYLDPRERTTTELSDQWALNVVDNWVGDRLFMIPDQWRPETNYPTVVYASIQLDMTRDETEAMRGLVEKLGETYPDAFKIVQRFANNEVAVALMEDAEGIKVRAMTRILESNVDRFEKVLVFAQFVDRCSVLVAERLQSIPSLAGYQVQHGSGNDTPTVRAERIRWFSEPGERRILVLTSAYGVGLNMGAADVLFKIEGGWTAAAEDQIDGRVRRPHPLGPAKLTYIVTLEVANPTSVYGEPEFETADMMLREAAENKRALSNRMMEWMWQRCLRVEQPVPLDMPTAALVVRFAQQQRTPPPPPPAREPLGLRARVEIEQTRADYVGRLMCHNIDIPRDRVADDVWLKEKARFLPQTYTSGEAPPPPLGGAAAAAAAAAAAPPSGGVSMAATPRWRYMAPNNDPDAKAIKELERKTSNLLRDHRIRVGKLFVDTANATFVSGDITNPDNNAGMWPVFMEALYPSLKAIGVVASPEQYQLAAVQADVATRAQKELLKSARRAWVFSNVPRDDDPNAQQVAPDSLVASFKKWISTAMARVGAPALEEDDMRTQLIAMSMQLHGSNWNVALTGYITSMLYGTNTL
jgi:superfamily II DNA or RNA helicase